MPLRDWVKVGGRRGVPGDAGGEPGHLTGRTRRGAVRVDGRDPLQPGPVRPVDEQPCGVERRARPEIVRLRRREARIDLLPALDDVPHDLAELVHHQLEVPDTVVTGLALLRA
jgi:hypothetical protein